VLDFLGDNMATTTINISPDKKTCAQCNKSGKGYYEVPSKPGKYICPKCVLKNIEREI